MNGAQKIFDRMGQLGIGFEYFSERMGGTCMVERALVQAYVLGEITRDEFEAKVSGVSLDEFQAYVRWYESEPGRCRAVTLAGNRCRRAVYGHFYPPGASSFRRSRAYCARHQWKPSVDPQEQQNVAR